MEFFVTMEDLRNSFFSMVVLIFCLILLTQLGTKIRIPMTHKVAVVRKPETVCMKKVTCVAAESLWPVAI